MKRTTLKATLLCIVWSFFGCSSLEDSVAAYRSPVHSIGFYNTENLFDTSDDPGKIDESFLPEGEYKWTKDRYEKKLDDIAQVVLGMGLPVLLGLCEVENQHVLEDLAANRALAPANYGIAHFESPDVRGIDVALLYDQHVFELEDARALRINFPKEMDKDGEEYLTRDILRVQGRLQEKPVYVFINHWPSRRGGQEASEPRRVFVAQQLRQSVDSILAKTPKANIIIMGDFNDEPNNKSISETLAAQSAKEGKGGLFNLMLPLQQQGLGTYNYNGTWNMLDQIIVSKSLAEGTDGLKVTRPDISKQPWMVFEHDKKGEIPNRTYGGDRYYGGVSDHFPVKAKISVIWSGRDYRHYLRDR
jgi:predicted extracellular nuclease